MIARAKGFVCQGEIQRLRKLLGKAYLLFKSEDAVDDGLSDDDDENDNLLI